MSRYCLEPRSNGTQIDIGYDPLFDTYYLQIRMQTSTGIPKLVEWHGSGFGGARLNSQHTDPEVLIEIARQYARFGAEIVDKLRADLNACSCAIEPLPVSYIGLPDQEVWRCRKWMDPPEGVPLAIPESRIFSRERQLAKVLLRDFLGSEPRANRLSKDFTDCVITDLAKNGSWLLTEREIADAVQGIEWLNGLRWIATVGCYASDVRLTDHGITPDEQLRRASKVTNHSAGLIRSCLYRAR